LREHLVPGVALAAGMPGVARAAGMPGVALAAGMAAALLGEAMLGVSLLVGEALLVSHVIEA
jgi:hypothetical protein